MRFNPKTIHFGGHETFQLRYSWLTKGYRYVSADSEFINGTLYFSDSFLALIWVLTFNAFIPSISATVILFLKLIYKQ